MKLFRHSLFAVLITLYLVLGQTLVRADSLDDLEAKKRGVSVEIIVLEKRVAELEKQNKLLVDKIASLEKKIDAKTEVTGVTSATEMTNTPKSNGGNTVPAQDVSDLGALINSLPETIRPLSTDTNLVQNKKYQDRLAWIEKNVVGKTVTFTLQIQDVYGSRKPQVTATVSGDITITYGDDKTTLGVNCTASAAETQKASSLTRKQTVTVKGKIDSVTNSTPPLTIRLSQCSFKE